jgi:hypothetical protein
MPDTQHDPMQDSRKPDPSSTGQQRKKMLKLSLIAGFGIIIVVVLVFVLTARGNNVAGKYYNEEGFAFELKSDGTVSYTGTDSMTFGDGDIERMGDTYTTSGNRIIFQNGFLGTQIEGNIDDGNIIIQGEVYIKK